MDVSLKYRGKAKGFTLIEMVVVIVVLAVLSVTAASAYLNVAKEARIATLLGAKDALATINYQVYTKAVLQNQQDVNDGNMKNIDLDNDGINDVVGHFGLIKYVEAAEELSGLDPRFTIRTWYGVDHVGEPYFLIGFTDRSPSSSNLCYVEVYYPDSGNGNVIYTPITDDC
ncbi:prepilin-type N-terminal cleavage/methylation domain-containing protein [Vibrio sp. LaRot3]|uniref:prepilin-type N-terminal cleavage/methylation domain-containing protein n=1 Tax=Vibrio sp. LaRot3 TaxID=2998829 RepID=UPI0022CDF876|nr:prepilin-type N-terminal cleavage/methylation domain-containing protein [Vibrio sp. LaRot3]MDA0150561.1 prepilin-type N-terminal cleavage/methylation domain-containing protein [Vibrio sp. LaRot3]